MDDTTSERPTLNVETMQQYVLIGIDADGKRVLLASTNINVEDMGGYIGTLQASLAFQTAVAAFLQVQGRAKPSRVVSN